MGKTMRRLLAWIVLLPPLLAVPLAAGLWYTVLLHVHGWVGQLSGFLQNLLDDMFVDSGLTGLATAVVVFGIQWLLYRLSERILPSRRGVRYLFFAILSLLLGFYFGYCLIRGYLPFYIPFLREAIILGCVSFSYLLNAFHLFSAFRKKNKTKAGQTNQPICLFCCQKKAGAALTVFAYVLGGPGLVNLNGRDKEIPGRNGERFDPDTFMRMKQAVLDEAFRDSEYLQYPQVVFAGYVSPKGDEALCTDMVHLNLREQQFAYVDLFHSSFNHNKGVSFGMTQVKKGRRVEVDWSARITESNQPQELQIPAAPTETAAVNSSSQPKKKMTLEEMFDRTLAETKKGNCHQK